MTNVHPFRPKRRISADLSSLVTAPKFPQDISDCVAQARCANRLAVRRRDNPEAVHVFRMFRRGWMKRARALKEGQQRKGA